MQNFSEKRKPENKAEHKNEEAPKNRTSWFKYVGSGGSCEDSDLEESFGKYSGGDGVFAIAVEVKNKVTRVAMETPTFMMLCQAMQKLLHGEDIDYIPAMPEDFARDMLDMFRKALAKDFNEKFHTYFKE